jgi:hypothetical protein
MTAAKKPNDTKDASAKVVIEVEQTDDGFRFSLKGLDALRELRETLAPLCCVPIGVACCGAPEKPQSGQRRGD